jgi:hypothetical protein
MSMKLRYMDKAISSETGSSGNMIYLPTGKEDKVIAHIIPTKFHTEPSTNSKMEVRLNPIMGDLVINMGVFKKKQIKRKKKETIAETTESVGEDQPV